MSNMASPVKERIVYEVRQVFLYIPSELSATGFELKIAGVVKVVKKVRHVNIIKREEDMYNVCLCMITPSHSRKITTVRSIFE